MKNAGPDSLKGWKLDRAANGDSLIANFGTDRLEVLTRDGRTRTLHETSCVNLRLFRGAAWRRDAVRGRRVCGLAMRAR